MKVRLIWVTPDTEKRIAYMARVSSSNQDNPEIAKLLRYCINHGHWSIFDMADMCLEIETSRAISAQLLRHSSNKFQEFSQRYADVEGFEMYEARAQSTKNRQSSTDTLPQEEKEWFFGAQVSIQAQALLLYREALDRGIAKEQARFLLPISAKTRLYMKGSIRSWIHYIQLRTQPDTQKEHRDIALACKQIFVSQLPIISQALQNYRMNEHQEGW